MNDEVIDRPTHDSPSVTLFRNISTLDASVAVPRHYLLTYSNVIVVSCHDISHNKLIIDTCICDLSREE